MIEIVPPGTDMPEAMEDWGIHVGHAEIWKAAPWPFQNDTAEDILEIILQNLSGQGFNDSRAEVKCLLIINHLLPV